MTRQLDLLRWHAKHHVFGEERCEGVYVAALPGGHESIHHEASQLSSFRYVVSHRYEPPAS